MPSAVRAMLADLAVVLVKEMARRLMKKLAGLAGGE
jgi:hypothetical protein